MGQVVGEEVGEKAVGEVGEGVVEQQHLLYPDWHGHVSGVLCNHYMSGILDYFQQS